MNRRDQPPVALVGLMGAGKSTVAAILGERLGVGVADLDAIIEAEEGRAIAEMFEREGEAWFRLRERERLEQVLESGVRVLACGGGIVTHPESRDLLRERCRVVWLDVPAATAAERLAGQTRERPMLGAGPPLERLRALEELRRPAYEHTAHVRVETSGRSPDQVADAVIAALAALESGPSGSPPA